MNAELKKSILVLAFPCPRSGSVSDCISSEGFKIDRIGNFFDTAR